MPRPKFRLGLRTVKTTIAVIISLFIASLFGELSIFPALAAISVMSRTFDEGLRECRNQAVGIFIGGVFGLPIHEVRRKTQGSVFLHAGKQLKKKAVEIF